MILNLKGINKHYLTENKVVTALNQINLNIDGNGLVLICGSSGSGKTTLLNIISGTDFYTEGDYYINGLDTSSFNEKDWERTRNKIFSFIYQDFKLIEDYSVKDNILLAANVANDNAVDINTIIKRVGLESFQNKKVRYLSGGQKQRVAIARALAKNTLIILADEPTANLDQNSSKDIAELLNEISKEKLVIISTHNEKLFDTYDSRKIVLSDGKVTSDSSSKKHIEKNSFESSQEISTKKRKFFGLQKSSKTGIWTFVSIFFTFIITLGIFSIGLYFTSASTTNYEQTELFNNLSPNRFIVNKHDNSPFTDEEINIIESNQSVNGIITNDVLSDSFLQSFFQDNSPLNSYIRRINDLPKDYHGIQPKNDNEIILANMSGMGYNEFEKNSINEYYVCDEYSHSLKICDTFSINSSAPVVYITDDLYNELNNELLLKYSNPTLEKNGSRINDYTFYFDKLCPKDILISDISSITNDNYYVNFTFLNNTVKSQQIDVYGVSNYAELAYKYSNRNKYVICNDDFFFEITKQNVFQLSIFSETTLALDSKYNVIYPNVINDGSINSQAVVILIIWFIIIFIISVVLVLATYLFLKNIYKNEIKNIYIRRLLGYSKKECFIFSLLRITIAESFSILTIITISFLSIYSPIKNQVFVLFSNLPISLVFMLILFISVFSLILLLRHIITRSDPYRYNEVKK